MRVYIYKRIWLFFSVSTISQRHWKTIRCCSKRFPIVMLWLSCLICTVFLFTWPKDAYMLLYRSPCMTSFIRYSFYSKPLSLTSILHILWPLSLSCVINFMLTATHFMPTITHFICSFYAQNDSFQLLILLLLINCVSCLFSILKANSGANYTHDVQTV